MSFIKVFFPKCEVILFTIVNSLKISLWEISLLFSSILFSSIYNFYLKIDEVRINQIYEQAKWQVLTEEIECTEEEAITFAALQFQVKVAAQNPQNSSATEEVDDIESALNELQVSCSYRLKNATPPLLSGK